MTQERKQLVSGIVRDAGSRLMRFIRSRVRSDADAQDVIQDVWHQLVAALDDGPIEHISAWLYSVARNRIIDRARRPRPESIEALEEDNVAFELPEGLLSGDDSPRVQLARNRFWDELHAALGALPAEQRQVFVWHELEGLSFQQIAGRTGENINTLLSRKRYAVLALRERLAPLRAEFQP